MQHFVIALGGIELIGAQIGDGAVEQSGIIGGFHGQHLGERRNGLLEGPDLNASAAFVDEGGQVGGRDGELLFDGGQRVGVTSVLHIHLRGGGQQVLIARKLF